MKATKTAYLSFTEWGCYMNEMYQEKKSRILNENWNEASEEGFDLLGSFFNYFNCSKL